MKKKLIEERERKEKEAERNFLYPKHNESKISANLEQSAVIEISTLENKKTVSEEKEISNKQTWNMLIEERERKEKETERNFLYPKHNESNINETLEQSSVIETSTLDNKKTVIEENEMPNKETWNMQKTKENEIDIIVSNEEPLIISPNIVDDKPSITEDTTFDGQMKEAKSENIISNQLNDIEVQITNTENEIVIAIEEEKDQRLQQESVIMKKELEKEKDLKQKELEKLKEQEKRKQD